MLNEDVSLLYISVNFEKIVDAKKNRFKIQSVLELYFYAIIIFMFNIASTSVIYITE